jgi:excisionase family DNA binding protein
VSIAGNTINTSVFSQIQHRLLLHLLIGENMQLALSIEEVITATKIGRTSIYEAINSGKLQAKKLGKRTIILKDDLDNFLSNLKAYPANSKGVNHAA